MISVEEQLAQARALGIQLSQEDLLAANALLGAFGPLAKHPRSSIDDWPDGYFAICAIVKNQYADIREWVEYHRYIGAKKIYLYDNNSTVRTPSPVTWRCLSQMFVTWRCLD